MDRHIPTIPLQAGTSAKRSDVMADDRRREKEAHVSARGPGERKSKSGLAETLPNQALMCFGLRR